MLPNLARLAPTGGGVGGDGLGGGQSDQQLRKAYEEAVEKVEYLELARAWRRREYVNVRRRTDQARTDMLIALRHRDDGVTDLAAVYSRLIDEMTATRTQYQEAEAAHEEATMHRDELREKMRERGLLP